MMAKQNTMSAATSVTMMMTCSLKKSQDQGEDRRLPIHLKAAPLLPDHAISFTHMVSLACFVSLS